MGAVVRGSIEAGGWTGGSNVPHIIELEGLPEGLSSFWITPDIYTRMQTMIEKSDAFIVFPGGAGSVQEMLALLIFKQLGSPMMKDKSVIIYNRPLVGSDKGFWDGLVDLLQPWASDNLFEVIDDMELVVNRMAAVLSKESVNG